MTAKNYDASKPAQQPTTPSLSPAVLAALRENISILIKRSRENSPTSCSDEHKFEKSYDHDRRDDNDDNSPAPTISISC